MFICAMRIRVFKWRDKMFGSKVVAMTDKQDEVVEALKDRSKKIYAWFSLCHNRLNGSVRVDLNKGDRWIMISVSKSGNIIMAVSPDSCSGPKQAALDVNLWFKQYEDKVSY